MFPASSTSLVSLKYLDAILCFVTTPVENTELIAFDCSACPVREQSSLYPWPEHLWHFAGFIIFVSSVVGRFISCPLSWMETLSPGERRYFGFIDTLMESKKSQLKLDLLYFMKIVWIFVCKIPIGRWLLWKLLPSSFRRNVKHGPALYQSAQLDTAYRKAVGRAHNHWALQIYETVFVATTPK